METQNRVNEYERNSHSVGLSMWHFEWRAKYRYKMFGKDKYLRLIEACIRRAASLHSIIIVELSVMSEHIHLVVKMSMNLSPAHALNILKGLSARLFFLHHEKARLRYPRGYLWSRGSFASSVGFIQAEVVRNYVRTQEEHHRGNLHL